MAGAYRLLKYFIIQSTSCQESPTQRAHTAKAQRETPDPSTWSLVLPAARATGTRRQLYAHLDWPVSGNPVYRPRLLLNSYGQQLQAGDQV